MEAAVVGTYAGAVSVDGATEAVTLTIARSIAPGGVAAAALRPLCGSRTFFVKPAGACMASSTMALTATLTSSGAIVKSGDLAGEFSAYHTLEGHLDLSNGPTRLYATYQNGRFSEWTYSPADGSLIRLDLRRE